MSDDLPRDQRRRTWAGEQLELSTTATRRDCLVRYLTLLEEQDLVPYQTDVEAFEILWDRKPSAEQSDPDDFAIIDEERACAAVVQFARTMFQLTADERATRFATLEAQISGDVRARAHLEDLRPALYVELPNAENESSPEVVALAEGLSRISALRPAARGTERRQWLQTVASNPRQWAKAAASLSRKYPQCARLDSWLVVRLMNGPKEDRIVVTAQRRAARAPRTVVTTKGKQGGGRRFSWWMIAVVMVAINGLRQLIPNSTPTSPIGQDYSALSTTDAPPPHAFQRLDEKTTRYLLEAPDDEIEKKGGKTTIRLFGLEQARAKRQEELKRIRAKQDADAVITEAIKRLRKSEGDADKSMPDDVHAPHDAPAPSMPISGVINPAPVTPPPSNEPGDAQPP